MAGTSGSVSHRPAVVTPSARNLVHYMALRRHDLRELQDQLAAVGLSSLGRADIWPVGDVALQAAIARALGLRKRPGEKAMEKLSRIWRPWRTVAARLFWTHEDGIRKEKREAAKTAKKKKGRK